MYYVFYCCYFFVRCFYCVFFFQAEDGIRDYKVTGVQTCALPIWPSSNSSPKMASIWLWSAAPLMFVAGSRPAGQSPEKPVHSSTVSVPPAFGAPLLACVWVLEGLLPPQAASARPSSRAVPPSQNLRTVPVVAVAVVLAPSLISLTHSISSVYDNK